MGKRITLSDMRDSGSWENRDDLKSFLASQLASGTLALVLGAGASIGFGFPDWRQLISLCYEDLGVSVPTRVRSCETLAQTLLDKHLGGSERKLATLIRRILYQNSDLSFNSMRESDLLASIGAIAMVTSRGSIARIVNFNFDTALEIYLRFFGYRVWSVGELPSWAARHDVTVYHPHGALSPPEGTGGDDDSRIVLTKKQFHRFASKEGGLWRNFLVSLFASHTCLFVGLSGDDPTLKKTLTLVKDSHASKELMHRHWGVRFDKGGNERAVWKENGVSQFLVNDYDEIPQFFFEVCQAAAQL